jgi:hypothetical protein
MSLYPVSGDWAVRALPSRRAGFIFLTSRVVPEPLGGTPAEEFGGPVAQVVRAHA